MSRKADTYVETLSDSENSNSSLFKLWYLLVWLRPQWYREIFYIELDKEYSKKS